MVRMLIIGYCYGIRSERRLCEEVSLNLAYRWFCRLGLEDTVPDHSTFSKNRHGRFRDADLLRYVFDTVVSRCHDEGLITGEGFATDASYIKADASRQKMVDGPVLAILGMLSLYKQERFLFHLLDPFSSLPCFEQHSERSYFHCYRGDGRRWNLRSIGFSSYASRRSNTYCLRCCRYYYLVYGIFL